MKRIFLASIAAFVIACASPSDPTSVGRGAGLPATLDARGGAGLQKVTLFFYTDDYGPLVTPHGAGLEVCLSWDGSLGETCLVTNKQGSVSTSVPKTVTSIHWRTEPFGPYCAAEGDVPLPYGVRENWIKLHSDPAHCP